MFWIVPAKKVVVVLHQSIPIVRTTLRHTVETTETAA
jgi:hypothetical protein